MALLEKKLNTGSSVLNIMNQKPLPIEPYDKEWGVGVSGIAEDPSPFPRINRILKRLKETDNKADHQTPVIYTEGYFKKYAAHPHIFRYGLTSRDLLHHVR